MYGLNDSTLLKCTWFIWKSCLPCTSQSQGLTKAQSMTNDLIIYCSLGKCRKSQLGLLEGLCSNDLQWLHPCQAVSIHSMCIQMWRGKYLPKTDCLQVSCSVTQIGTFWCSCHCLHSRDSVWIGTEPSFQGVDSKMGVEATISIYCDGRRRAKIGSIHSHMVVRLKETIT